MQVQRRSLRRWRVYMSEMGEQDASRAGFSHPAFDFQFTASLTARRDGDQNHVSRRRLEGGTVHTTGRQRFRCSSHDLDPRSHSVRHNVSTYKGQGRDIWCPTAQTKHMGQSPILATSQNPALALPDSCDAAHKMKIFSSY